MRCIAFDKTGTLTEGRPRVAATRGFQGTDEGEVLRIAAALEATSEHPLGAAIVAAARDAGIASQRAQFARTIRGAGVQGEVDGLPCFAGSPRYVMEYVGMSTLPTELRDGPAGAITVLVGRGTALLGAIHLTDYVRRDAKVAIAELRELDIRTVVMLTGDSRSTAENIAAELDIDEVHAELLPQDKVRIVEQLVPKFQAVAMVGDGVNDAPALAAAHVGVALGMNASDTALETADVVSLSPHLRRVPALVRLGQSTRKILAQNITLALTIKLSVLVVAMIGWGSLWAAVAADVGASLLVVFNGMRLLRPVQPGRQLV